MRLTRVEAISNEHLLATSIFRWRQRREFFGHKAAFLVRAVAEWLALRLAAAAKCYGRFIRGKFEGVALVVDDRDGPFDHKRAVLATTDADVGHLSAECGVRIG
jgi:hypothetical protein